MNGKNDDVIYTAMAVPCKDKYLDAKTGTNVTCMVSVVTMVTVISDGHHPAI